MRDEIGGIIEAAVEMEGRQRSVKDSRFTRYTYTSYQVKEALDEGDVRWWVVEARSNKVEPLSLDLSTVDGTIYQERFIG